MRIHMLLGVLSPYDEISNWYAPLCDAVQKYGVLTAHRFAHRCDKRQHFYWHYIKITSYPDWRWRLILLLMLSNDLYYVFFSTDRPPPHSIFNRSPLLLKLTAFSTFPFPSFAIKYKESTQTDSFRRRSLGWNFFLLLSSI